MKTDIQIAQEATMLPIKDVAANYGITEDDLELYGKYKAKFSDEFMNSLDEKPDGKLVLMTAINPTPAGEGKTTITVKKGSKSYRCKLTVAKYASPVSSIKIGKTTISGKKFNKNAYIYQKYSKYAGKKVAINVKAKKGWKLLELSYGQRNWKKAKNIKNGSTVRVKGGAGFGVLACMQNTATQQIEFVIVLYK